MTDNIATILSGRQVQETGRKYCEDYGNILHKGHFAEIAAKHWLEQQKVDIVENHLIVDTDAIVTLYYLSMYCNESIDPEAAMILSIAKLEDYDLVIYLEPTVPWVEDGYRFAESTRKEDSERLKRMYKYMTPELYKKMVFIDSPDYDDRLQQAMRAIRRLP
jgi:HTH-type transcriptional repressor of NAD biosynthesis genes